MSDHLCIPGRDGWCVRCRKPLAVPQDGGAVVKLREYTAGPFTIVRGPHGAAHGLAWGIWRDGKLVDSARTLKGARRYVATLEHANAEQNIVRAELGAKP